MRTQDVAFFDGTTSGHLTSRLTNDVNVMMEPIRSSLSTLLYNLITLVGGVTMCYVTSYQLSLLAFVTVGPIMCVRAQRAAHVGARGACVRNAPRASEHAREGARGSLTSRGGGDDADACVRCVVERRNPLQRDVSYTTAQVPRPTAATR